MQKAEVFALSLVLALAVHGALLPADSSRSAADAGVEGGLVIPGWPFARTPSELQCRSTSAELSGPQPWRTSVHDTVEPLDHSTPVCTEHSDTLPCVERSVLGPRLSMVRMPLALTR